MALLSRPRIDHKSIADAFAGSPPHDQQLTTHVDRCFPGLGRVLWSVALSKSGRLILAELPDPIRVARLGPSRLRSFAANRGVRMTTPLGEKIVDAARNALTRDQWSLVVRLIEKWKAVSDSLGDPTATDDAVIERVGRVL